jgi:hypothetical protein
MKQADKRTMEEGNKLTTGMETENLFHLEVVKYAKARVLDHK